jgi:L-threonylcarbamoyladenylate synthase
LHVFLQTKSNKNILDFNDDIENCLTVLNEGGIILYPTDTIWGIGCDATNADAVKKIFSLKKRSETKSMIILMADERDVLKYVAQPDLRVFDFLKTVKKPTTIIYDGAIGLAENLINNDGTIAIRIVHENFCKHLIKRFRKPIVSTSANISGDIAPQFFNDINKQIKDGVNYIVNHRQDDNTAQQPSSIIKWNKDGTQTIIRS